MAKRDRLRLQHMLEAARRATLKAQGRSRGSLDEDDNLALALARLLEIVGEAASQVTDETRTSLPHVPWRKMVGMRNILIHQYADVDLDMVWETVQQDLPPLVRALEDALAKE